jgi:AcrR family transcriptional regulator
VEQLGATEQYELPIPGTLRGQRTRGRIMAAAEDVFGQMGYEPASITAITQAAGVAQGTFYVYFPSKHSIFVELIKDFAERVRAAIAGAGVPATSNDRPSRAQIERAGLEAWLAFCAEHPGLYRVMREAAIFAPETHRWYYESFVAAYVAHFERLSGGRGEIDDVETIAYVMVAIADWIGLRWVIWEGKRPPKRVLDQLTDLLDRGFAALVDAPPMTGAAARRGAIRARRR